MCVCVCVCVCVYIYIYVEHSISFQTFFVQAFKIVVDSWKFSMLLLCILWLTNFYDFSFKSTATAGIEIYPDCHSWWISAATAGIGIHPDCQRWWISKMQSGREDTLEERYAIKFCFKLEKMPQRHMECFRLLLDHLALIEHQFLSGIRDSRKTGSLWGMMRGVGGVRKSIHQSWLVKGLGLGLLCWGFKGVQKEIPSEEASTLQIGSVAFPPGQCTSQQHPCHRLFDQDGHQDSSSPFLSSRPCSLWLLAIP